MKKYLSLMSLKIKRKRKGVIVSAAIGFALASIEPDPFGCGAMKIVEAAPP